jgi:hypothetical protein
VRNEHFFRPKNVKIATFAICSAPVRCYECSSVHYEHENEDDFSTSEFRLILRDNCP